MGWDVCDRWAALDPERAAIIDVDPARPEVTTFGALRESSNRLANALRGLGIGPGDRVAVFLPQGAEAITAQIAVYKLGAIVLPLAAVFGIDALAYRFADAAVRLVITDAPGAAKIAAIRPTPASLETVVSVDGRDGAVLGFADLLARQSDDFDAVETMAEDPALMIYTSGTTGLAQGRAARPSRPGGPPDRRAVQP